MPRVLILHPSDDGYGLDRVLAATVSALVGRGMDVCCLIDSENPGNGWVSAQLAGAGVQFRKTPLAFLSRRRVSRTRHLLRTGLTWARATPALVRECRVADLVYVNGLTLAPAAFAARLSRRPVLWHVHEIVGGTWLLRFVVPLLSNVQVCVSGAVAASLGLARRPSCHVVHNGVTQAADALAQREPSPSQPVEVGIVARVNRWKGHHFLAAAWERVAAEGLPARLHVVGGAHPDDPAAMTEFRGTMRCLADSGSVVFHGEVASARDIMSSLDILVAPSIRPDPFPLSVIEGMSAGLAVVATAVGGHPEAIVDGVSGVLIAPDDVAALHDALVELIRDQNRRRTLGAAARTRALREFSADRYASRIARVVEEAMAAR